MYDRGKFEVETPVPVRELDDVSKRLLRAAEIKARSPGLCALAVIAESCGGQADPIFEPAWNRFKSHHGFARNDAVYEWHDTKASASEVIAALEAAAFAYPARETSGPS